MSQKYQSRCQEAGVKLWGLLIPPCNSNYSTTFKE